MGDKVYTTYTTVSKYPLFFTAQLLLNSQIIKH